MKRKIYLLVMAIAAVLFAMPARAFDLGDVRVNARFLTDRMAFELKLNQRQYNDLYEINFDFFSNVDPYVSALARADARAMDAYYRYHHGHARYQIFQCHGETAAQQPNNVSYCFHKYQVKD